MSPGPYSHVLLLPRVFLPHHVPLSISHFGPMAAPLPSDVLKCRHLLQVIKEVYSGCSGPVDSECPPPSSSPVHKAELEKVRACSLQEQWPDRGCRPASVLMAFSGACTLQLKKKAKPQPCAFQCQLCTKLASVVSQPATDGDTSRLAAAGQGRVGSECRLAYWEHSQHCTVDHPKACSQRTGIRSLSLCSVLAVPIERCCENALGVGESSYTPRNVQTCPCRDARPVLSDGPVCVYICTGCISVFCRQPVSQELPKPSLVSPPTGNRSPFLYSC